MSLGYLLDTYDLRFGHVINFLETFEKSFKSKYEISSEYSEPILNFIGVLCGHDFALK